MTDELTKSQVLRKMAELIEMGYERPWQGFEVRWEGTPVWFSPEDEEHSHYLLKHFHKNHWRLCPRTIRIGNRDVPEPMREPPELGTGYYVADPVASDLIPYRWNEPPTESKLLRRGLCHRTPDAAEQHARALIEVSGGTLEVE